MSKLSHKMLGKEAGDDDPLQTRNFMRFLCEWQGRSNLVADFQSVVRTRGFDIMIILQIKRLEITSTLTKHSANFSIISIVTIVTVSA